MLLRASVARWVAGVLSVGAAASVLAACGGSSPSGNTTTASAPLTRSALVAGSKHESGLLMFSNALSSQMQVVVNAFKKRYPWIHVTFTDDEDPVVFSKYEAEHATGTRTADILIASAPGLWAGAVKNGIVRPFTPTGISDFPSFVNQGGGLYVFSADPAITIYNKLVLKGQPPATTIAQIAQEGNAGRYKVATYTINNNFGYSAFYGFVHQKGWSALDELGKTAKPVGDGDVIGQDVLQGGFGVGVFESGLARGPIQSDPKIRKIAGWEYTTDFTPLIPRGIGITAGAKSPDSAQLFLNFVFSNPGQQALCDAGFEADSNTFKPSNGCPNTLKALYAAVGGSQNTYMTPFSEQVAKAQPAFTARWKKAFGQ